VLTARFSQAQPQALLCAEVHDMFVEGCCLERVS